MYCINYVIKQGDSLYTISRQFNVPIDAIMKANPLLNVYRLQVGEAICILVSVPQSKATHFTTYLVEDNDSLQSVLDKNNINLADLMQLNKASDIMLLPGTTLQVPVMGEGEGGVTL